MIKLLLVGDDNTLHGGGMINPNIIATRSILKRNERYYTYSSISSDGTTTIVKFREVVQPYIVTEF